MWPSKHHIGVQLAYGVQGNGIVLPEEGPSSLEELPSFQPKIHFPRLRDQGPHLRPIKNSSWTLPSTTLNEDSLATTSMSWFRKKAHSTIYAPDLITEALTVELAPMNELFAYDPTEGDKIILINLGVAAYSDPIVIGNRKVFPKVKNNVLHLKGLAYVCGDNNTNLCVTPLLPTLNKATNLDSNDTKELLLPNAPKETNNYEYCIFPTPVLQIQASPFFPIIAIRCRSTIHFIKFLWLNDPDEKGPTLETLPCIIDVHELSGHEFAHIEFSSDDKHLFSIIDVRGNFAVWSLRHDSVWTTELRYTSVPSNQEKSSIPLTIANSEDLSAWKKICWDTQSSSLIAFSRKEATIFKLSEGRPNSSQKLITSDLWANIWDFKSFLKYALLLTSRELIFLESEKEAPFKRLLSWKHFLDDEDPSFRLHVCEAKREELFICSVFSQNTPMAMIYTLGFNQGRPALLCDPYFIRTSEDCLTFFFDSIRYNVDDDMTFFQVQSTGSGLHYSSLHGSESLELALTEKATRSASTLETEPTKDIFNMISIAEATNAFHSFSTSERMTHENEEIREDDNADGPTLVQLVQNYAFRLGNDIKKRLRIEEELPSEHGTQDSDEVSSNGSAKVPDVYIPSFTPFAAVADCVPLTIDDMEEFDSMVDQLSDFYNSCGIEVQKNVKQALKSLSLESEPSVQQLKEALDNVYTDHPNNGQAAMILANSLFKVSNEDIETRLQNLYREEVKKCDPELTSMFDDWDIQFPRERAKSAPPTVDTKKRGLLHRALTQNSQHMSQATSQLPQPSQAFPDSSQELPEPSLSQAISRSQKKLDVPKRQSQTLKRPGSQSTSQRKKKKKGGFA